MPISNRRALSILHLRVAHPAAVSSSVRLPGYPRPIPILVPRRTAAHCGHPLSIFIVHLRAASPLSLGGYPIPIPALRRRRAPLSCCTFVSPSLAAHRGHPTTSKTIFVTHLLSAAPSCLHSLSHPNHSPPSIFTAHFVVEVTAA
jgi:hypothetical protein